MFKLESYMIGFQFQRSYWRKTKQRQNGMLENCEEVIAQMEVTDHTTDGGSGHGGGGEDGEMRNNLTEKELIKCAY